MLVRNTNFWSPPPPDALETYVKTHTMRITILMSYVVWLRGEAAMHETWPPSFHHSFY